LIGFRRAKSENVIKLFCDDSEVIILVLLLGFFILCRTSSTSVQTCKSNESENEKFHTRENGRYALALPRAAILPSLRVSVPILFSVHQKTTANATYTRRKQEIKIHPYITFLKARNSHSTVLLYECETPHVRFKLRSTGSNFHRSLWSKKNLNLYSSNKRPHLQ